MLSKLPKARLALLGYKFPVTHDLGALLDLLGRSVLDTAEFRGLIALNPLAVQFRYEALGNEMEPLDRDSLARNSDGWENACKRRSEAHESRRECP